MGGLSRSTKDAASTPGQIELVEVIDVNIDQMTVDVQGVYSQKAHVDVPVGSLYAHPEHGGGAHVLPEVGAQGYLFTCSGGTKMLMGFVVTPKREPPTQENGENQQVTPDSELKPSFAGFKPNMEPGDIILGTKDGNRVVVRRGGIIQLGATPLSQTVYIPISNIVREYFMRMEKVGPAGDLIWGPSVTDFLLAEDADVTETAVLLHFRCREVAQDDEGTVEVALGRLDNKSLDVAKDGEHIFGDGAQQTGLGVLTGNNGVLSITVRSRDTAAVTYKFQLSRAGGMFMLADGGVHIETSTAFLSASQFTIQFGGNELTGDAATGMLRALVQQMVLQAVATLTVNAGSLVLTAGGVTTRVADGMLDVQGQAMVGGAGGMPVVVDRDLLLNLINHVHPVPNAAPSVGGVPVLATASPTLSGLAANRATFLYAK